MKFRTFLFFLLLVGFSLRPSLAQSQRPDRIASFRCPVTVPNGSEPPSAGPPSKFPVWVAERNHQGDTLLVNQMHGMKASFHGNGQLWTLLPPGGARWGVAPNADGTPARAMLMDWWKGNRGGLAITGRRLDGAAGPLHVGERGGVNVVPSPWEDGIRHGIRHETTGVIFPGEGCWEITGKIDDISDSVLTFVVNVRFPK
jgi:hypothetical protein